MRLTFITGSLGGGGAERVVSELATAMSHKGHEISIVVIAARDQQYAIDPSVRVVDCAKKHAIRGLSFMQRVGDIRRALRELSPDTVISFNTPVNIYAVLACRRLPCRLVLAERNDPVLYPADKTTRRLRARLYKRADAFVFQTEEAQAFFSEDIRRRSTVIFNPINPCMPDPAEGPRSKRFVTAVRLEPQKNIPMAIDAFHKIAERHPDFTLEIYGRGALREELQQQIDRLGLSERVTLMGNSSTLYEDIKDAYAFVLSSDYEGMSNSMLEAMALGIPTISTDYPSGGARAVIENGVNGMLIPVGDTDALADAMATLICDPQLAQAIGREGLKLRETLSVDSVTEQWLRFVEQ